jgi:glycosyltransferase involved in cell wall biosynthesis
VRQLKFLFGVRMGEVGLVSVIMPTYNMAKYLPQAIESVLSQTYKKLELHVVDDGSSDSTPDVMKQFFADDRVKYYRQDNAGVSSARNIGIGAARGEFIALCDADDLWVANKLEVQLPCFEGRPELGVVYSNSSYIDTNNVPLKSWQPQRYSGRITDKLLLENFVTSGTSVIRRKCLDDVGLYDTSLRTSEDYDLWLRISVKYAFLYLNAVTYLYRRWEGQVSISGNEPQFYEDAIRVKRAFVEAHRDLVGSSLESEMWAGVLSGRAQCTMRNTGSRLAALSDILTAVAYRPLRFETWKAALKVLINRVE